ncbi:lymphocyte cytosolic protein 2a [Cololabis saira]|uniref:lymphocyte cytosolic protein 2a n=1 Tax=Cololabis saira TaxID=129043 RepID=UPI002AD23A6F|nr:lymphocyte cytosolic protein 2a [Cololabis saira]
MSSHQVPTRSEVMGWNPQQLAEYLKRRNLAGCDKIVLKNSISGSRFVNLSDNDLQKFPKLHAPMVSKISSEISKKEDKRGLFGKKISTPKYSEAEMTNDVQGWGDDEFDDEEFDNDYESPYSDNDGSGGDYESPNEDAANDYEPPPTEPPEDLVHKLCPTLPIGDGEYIDKRDNHLSNRALPPAVCPRPPVHSLSAQTARMPGEPSSRRDPSPHCVGRASGKFLPEPPQIFRDNKPGRDSGSTPSPVRGPQRNTLERPSAQSWRPQPEASDPPTWSKPPILPPPSSTSVSRSNSSVRPPPTRLDGRREQTHDEVLKTSTFPLQNKSLPPRPGIPGVSTRNADSLPPCIPSAASLPPKMNFGMGDSRDSRGSIVATDRSLPCPPATTSLAQDLDPLWYVGKVTRGQAEGGLKRLRKDGAYLVRDSTRQLPNQPYTLMVFYQDKVFNIQIRQQNHNFQLGTGLKVQETFPCVSNIISHYSHSPLLLIDAKNRSSSQQNQCVLSEPAAYSMSRQKWS